MTSSSFHYLFKVHSIPFIYEEDKPIWNKMCSFLLNTFFMQRKLEYCELLGLRKKISYYKRDAQSNARKFANILNMYNAHIGEAPESRTSQYNLEEVEAECTELPHSVFLNQSDSEFIAAEIVQ